MVDLLMADFGVGGGDKDYYSCEMTTRHGDCYDWSQPMMMTKEVEGAKKQTMKKVLKVKTVIEKKWLKMAWRQEKCWRQEDELRGGGGGGVDVEEEAAARNWAHCDQAFASTECGAPGCTVAVSWETEGAKVIEAVGGRRGDAAAGDTGASRV